MGEKRYKAIVLVDCGLVLYYVLAGIILYTEYVIQFHGIVSGLIILDLVFLIVSFYFCKFPKVKHVSFLVQNIWDIMKTLVVIALVLDLGFINIYLHVFSFCVTLAFIFLQIYFYKNDKFYFEKHK